MMQAVDITNPQKQKEVLHYFEQLMKDESAWRRCAEEIISGVVSDPQHMYLNLQVTEHYLKNKYSHTNNEGDRETLRRLMWHWLKRQESCSDPPFLKKKMAQIFALVFLADFPRRWLNFLEEVFSDLGSTPSTEFFLRVLLEIDSEIADRDIQRTKEELQRNTLVKDSMRETCVPQLVQSWQHILVTHSANNSKITELCLNVIGGFVSWIEIGLIANETFVPLIVNCLRNSETQEAATDCVCSILSKGMDPVLKLQLVDAMDRILKSSGIYNVNDDTDVETVARVAELINCLGTVLIDCWNKTMKAAQIGTANEQMLPLIEEKALPMLACLSYDDIDVSGSVTEFAQQYVHVLKQLSTLSPTQTSYLKDLLTAVLRRYRFPEDYNHDKEGENEAVFLEYRKELKIIFLNIGLLDNTLLMNTAKELISGSLINWKSLQVVDVSLAIEILYFLGETLPANPGAHFASNEPNALILKDLLRLLITSEVSQQTHPCSVLQYFECVVRYDKFYAMEPSLIPLIVTSFLDQRGLHHPDGKVRSRVAYLFSRFVKQQKTAIMECVEEILSQLGDLLAVSPGKDSADRLITPEDQLFLFEATGTVIVFGNFQPEQKRAFMEQLLGSLVVKFNEGLQVLTTLSDEEERKIVVYFLNNIMSYASRTTKAFNNQMSMQTCNCSDLFLQLMGTFLNAVSLSNPTLLDGLRQYLHRTVICLEKELLPHLNLVLEKFLTVAANSSLKALQDFLLLVQQMISKFKADIVPHIQLQMGGILSVVWEVLNRQHDMSDELVRGDVTYLRRAYFQLLAVIISNKAVDLFTCLGNDVLVKVLTSVTDSCTESEDALAQRTCFSILGKLVDAVKIAPGIAVWLDPFLFEKAFFVCFRGPFRRGFDFDDAQCVLVLHEIASSLKKFHSYKATEVETFLRVKCFPQLGLEAKAAEDFILTLKNSDNKSFQRYLKAFFDTHVKAVAAKT